MNLALPLVFLGLLPAVLPRLQAADPRCYEMRVYYAAPGKFEAMHARFRNHTLKLFEKHGMRNLGYWVPVEDADGATNKLIYLLAHPSRDAREAAWKSFGADPDWQKAYRESEAQGRLVEKAEITLLSATDYSPEIRPTDAAPRVFELRTYTAAPGRLDALNARFREHTLKLFAKHGMTHFGYWVPAEGQPGAGQTLIYLLAHRDRAAAEASFNAFRADPDWVAARKASEEKAGGSLTAPDGVKSVFLKATDYSPTR